MIIYKITNLINNKFYIGQDIKNDPKYFGSGKLINSAIKKYGIENFKKEILEFCTDEKHMDEREIFWIKELDATNRKIAYNICEGGKSYRTMRGENNARFGKHHSEETKNIIREKRKLQKMSKEQKDVLREKWKGEGNPGKNKSKETIEKLRIVAKELNRYGETSSMIGKKHSDETKKHWSEIRKGKNTGESNATSVRYIIESPEGEIIKIETKKAVMNFIGCSEFFFSSKKYKNYKLIGKEKIHNNKIIIDKQEDEYYTYYIEAPNGEELIFNKKSEIIEKIKCSLYFFKSKKFKGYKIINRIVKNNNL